MIFNANPTKYQFATAPVVTPLAASAGTGNGERGTAGADAASLPKRLKVLSWGENLNAHGRRVFVGEKFLRALAAPAYPYAKVAIDFEHNTVPGTPEYERTREPRAIAGYAGVEAVEGAGVFLNVVRWTPDGLAHAADYEDLSAAPVTDAAGEVVALPSVALCRAGAVPGIEFVECPLSALPTPDGRAPDGGPEGQDQNQNQTVTKEGNMDYKTVLAKLLGLPPGASDEELQAAADAMGAKAEKEAAEKAAKEEAAKAAQEALSARVDALEKGREDDARQRVLLSARLEGKQVSLSAEAVAKLSVKDLEEHVAALPVTVPLSAVTPAVVKETPRAQAIDEGIMRNLGLTEEDLK